MENMHVSEQYLNLVHNGSSWKLKRTRNGVEVHYGGEVYLFGNDTQDQEESTGSCQSFESVMLQQELNQPEDMKDKTLVIDHGEEGVKKTEDSERKNSEVYQEFKKQLYGLVKEHTVFKGESSGVKKEGEAESEEKTMVNDHGEEGVKETENSERKKSVMYQEFKKQLYGLVKEHIIVKEGDSEVQKEDKNESAEETLAIDHGEEGVEKTENVEETYSFVCGDPLPEMPQEFRDRILELFGENSIVAEEFMNQKEVEEKDCCDIENRLLISNGTLLEQFLEEDERKVLPRNVKIIEPGLELGEVQLTSWGIQMYVLEGKWGEVRARNSIVPGMILHLFGVRLGNGLRGEIWDNALKNLLFVVVDVTPADMKAWLITEAEDGDGESSKNMSIDSSPHVSSGSSQEI